MTGTKRVVGSLHLISTITRQVTYVPDRCRTASLESSRSPDPSLSLVSLHHEHKLCQCKGDKGPVTGVTRTILQLCASGILRCFPPWNNCHRIQACALGSQAYLHSLMATPGTCACNLRGFGPNPRDRELKSSSPKV